MVVLRGSGTARLVVIDMQEAFRRPGQWHVPRYDEAATRIDRLLPLFGDPLFTRFVPDPAEPGSWGAYYDRWDQMRLPPEDAVWGMVLPGYDGGATLDLPTFGKWGTAMAGLVPVGGELILTGVATDCCVLSTALAAVDAGRFVTVVTDACAGQDDAAHDGAVELMGLLSPMVRLVTCDQLLADR
ncbi:cysteine hydrolase family protein [Arthrobacter sp. JSM 101049]|uniref:cysteine hydrolase family protein n=1 Tax=Arthrobacter sp. JSM 101049 TaxID=929097 RepID=UPI0035643A91